MKKSLLYYFISKFLLIFSVDAYADGVEAFMDVSATIEPSCTVNVSNLNFGPYNLAESNETATIAILCTNGSKFMSGLDAGSSSGSTETSRSMTNNGKLLKYSLYQDETMRRLWGSESSNTLSGVGTGKLQYFKIYGRIAENQKLPAALYTDNILISLNIDGLSGFGYQLSVGMTVAAHVQPDEK